jgi:hypothetical protein
VGLTLISWSTIAVPLAVQFVPVIASGFTMRFPRAMRLMSSLGSARPRTEVAERMVAMSAEVYMINDFAI